MAVEQRNFRSQYYEKVGFRGVEEKKSVEILLSDKPLSKPKLTQFCLRFPVPASYRNTVWKVVLDVIPVYSDSQSFVSEQRTGQYEDLLHALRITGRVDKSTPSSHVVVLMWLLEEGKLKYDHKKQLNERRNERFLLVAENMWEILQSDVDAYWVSKAFYKRLQTYQGSLHGLIANVNSLIEKEDPSLYRHLANTDSLQALPLSDWFNSCYAGVIPDLSLVRIWDKFVGGSLMIFSFMAVALLITLKQSILTKKNSTDVLKAFGMIDEDCAEIAVSKAIDIWQKHGSPLGIPLLTTEVATKHLSRSKLAVS